MPGVLKRITAVSFGAAFLTAVLFWLFDRGIYLTLAITFGTTAYHLGMRLLVGLIYHGIMGNRADYTKKWYQPRPWEARVYRFLRVKAWKKRMPAYRPEFFDRRKHSWDEIAQAMCQAELVHETNAVLSFIPLAASACVGAFFVFLATSICGAVLDLLFVAMQRYNRPRIIKLAAGQKRRATGEIGM